MAGKQTRRGDPRLVVVGSVGIDTVETPSARRENLLGGSVSYACAAAAFFVPVGMVGVVGDDFPDSFLALYRRFGIDLTGLQRAKGRTFRWSGVYESNMNQRRTRETQLNVFESFSPDLPAPYRRCPFLFLANISPELQLHVLSQLEKPRFVAADTMDLWIRTAPKLLLQVISRVNMLVLNESEAQLLTGEHNLLRAAKRIQGLGPSHVVIKKGEHGALVASRNMAFALPAYPLEKVVDPTGAGDAFAGGLMGKLARNDKVSDRAIRLAVAYGTVVASFGVESFSLGRLARISFRDIEKRVGAFRGMLRL